MMRAFLVVAANVFAGFEFVDRAAVRALGFTGVGHIQVNLGMAVPEFHVGFGAGAKHAALTVQVFGQKFNCVAHFLFLRMLKGKPLKLW
jgi:hypothetical protein